MIIILQLVSNDEYNSGVHKVRIKSDQDARVSVATFFNPPKRGDSDLFGPLPELVTAEKPAQYRNFTITEFLKSREEFGHGGLSTDQFRVRDNMKHFIS
jgi:isopenicillin N synthase-like dioxygenase